MLPAGRGSRYRIQPVLVGVGSLLICLPLTQPFERGHTSVRTLLALSGYLALALASVVGRQRGRRTSGAAPQVLILIAMLSAISLIGSPAPLVVGSRLALLAVLGHTLRVQELAQAVWIAVWSWLTLLVIGSCVVAALGGGILQGRLRGLFANPNGLGIAGIVALVGLLEGSRLKQFWRISAMFAILAAVALTGSRSTVLGLALAAVYLTIVSVRTAHLRVAIGCALLLFAVPAMQFGLRALVSETSEVAERSEGLSGVELQRGNSREEVWKDGLGDAQVALPFGEGIGTSATEYGSSPLLLMVETGWVSPLILLLVYGVVGRALFASQSKARTAGLIALTVTSLFEGWLLASGSHVRCSHSGALQRRRCDSARRSQLTERHTRRSSVLKRLSRLATAAGGAQPSTEAGGSPVVDVEADRGLPNPSDPLRSPTCDQRPAPGDSSRPTRSRFGRNENIPRATSSNEDLPNATEVRPRQRVPGSPQEQVPRSLEASTIGSPSGNEPPHPQC